MKKLLLIAVLFSAAASASAQTPYTSNVDDKNVTILNGIITKYAIINNSAFTSWYGPNQTAYSPNAELLKAMQAAKDKVQFIIFGGTWCEDTQFILPKFFKMQELSGIQDNSVSFFAVDRKKTTLGHLNEAFKITNVPTIIVMKDGKEIGRLVEYGKTGKWDEELASILNN